MITIKLEGPIPSKKNSRINRSDGKSFPNKKFIDWQNYAIIATRQQTRERFFKPVRIDVEIRFSTNIRADLDNRVTSILDMLVEALVIRDDKWQDVPIIKASAIYAKGNPGATICIRPIA